MVRGLNVIVTFDETVGQMYRSGKIGREQLERLVQYEFARATEDVLIALTTGEVPPNLLSKRHIESS